MKYIQTIVILSILTIISSCRYNAEKVEVSELEFYHLHGNILSAVVTLTNHENSQTINIDTITFPTLPSELLQNKNYTLTFNKDKTIKSIISSDSLFIVNNIRINDSISHMIKLENNVELRRIKKTTDSTVMYQYLDYNNNVISNAEYRIDTVAKIARFRHFHIDGKILVQKDLYYSDDKTIQRLDIKNFNVNQLDNAPIIHSFNYKYDDKKHVISCEFEDIYGTLNKSEYKYIYDEKDNWIEMITILNGEKISTIRRTITYY